LPAAEILFDNFPDDAPKIVDYAAKWDTESPEYKATTRSFDFEASDAPLIEKLNLLCLKCWDLFSLQGAVRIDFRVDEDGNPWVLEVNANPCLSADAGFMAAALKGSATPQDVMKRLIPPHPIQRV
jgi:D-alanine-D-alanine ligase